MRMAFVNSAKPQNEEQEKQIKELFQEYINKTDLSTLPKNRFAELLVFKEGYSNSKRKKTLSFELPPNFAAYLTKEVLMARASTVVRDSTTSLHLFHRYFSALPQKEEQDSKLREFYASIADFSGFVDSKLEYKNGRIENDAIVTEILELTAQDTEENAEILKRLLTFTSCFELYKNDPDRKILCDMVGERNPNPRKIEIAIENKQFIKKFFDEAPTDKLKEFVSKLSDDQLKILLKKLKDILLHRLFTFWMKQIG